MRRQVAAEAVAWDALVEAVVGGALVEERSLKEARAIRTPILLVSILVAEQVSEATLA